jgi:KDO2-lipid IV(A) lauroyltransferase
MQQAFGEVLSQTEIKKLAQGFYTHMLRSMGENLVLPWLAKKTLQKKALVKGTEYLDELTATTKKGAIFITGHLGNWELGPIAGMSHLPRWQGYIDVVRKPLKPAWLEKALFKRYRRAGLNVINKNQALLKVYHALRKNHALAFVLDQHASCDNGDGIKVAFFEKDAGTFQSAARIAQHKGIPVLGFRCYRRQDNKHVLEFLPPIPWATHKDPQEAVRLNTLKYNQLLERLIVDYPEQWLWSHKRWKV